MIMDLFFGVVLFLGVLIIGVAIGFYIGQNIANTNWIEAVKDHNKEMKDVE